MSIYVKDAAGNRVKAAGNGLPGPAGKSAYQYAVEGGFSGTEDEFRALMGVRSNQSLLDNAYWAQKDCIINQRGQEEYTGVGYTIDRWVLYSNDGSIAITDNGILFKGGTSGHTEFRQRIENPKRLSGKVLTLSFLFFGSLPATLHISDSPGFAEVHKDVSVTENLCTWTFRVAENPPEDSFINCWMDGNVQATMRAAKLELGSVQTLAHKEGDAWVLNDPPPDKALELAKCQHYYRKIDQINTNTLGSPNPFIAIPVYFGDMRVPPTIAVDEIRAGDNSVSNLTIESVQNTKNSITAFKMSGNLPVNTFYKFIGITLDANL